ncbi:MAG: hypothetical protein HYY93_05630 [Planctomycetes bacterium]|nr:hypothetical protein [Planctomycetota bacterium]
MRGTSEEVRIKTERYNQFVGQIRQAAMEMKDDLVERLVSEAQRLFNPHTESWWIDRLEDEGSRAKMVARGVIPDFSEDPAIAQRRVLRTLTAREWVQAVGPVPYVRDGIAIDPYVAADYVDSEVARISPRGVFGEEETKYLLSLLPADNEDRFLAIVKMLGQSSHRSAWDFAVQQVSLLASQPPPERPDFAAVNPLKVWSGILVPLAERPGVHDSGSWNALEQAYRAMARLVSEERGSIDPRSDLVEAMRIIAPNEARGFFRDVVRSYEDKSGATPPWRVRKALEGLSGMDPADYSLLVETVDSSKYFSDFMASQAIDRLFGTIKQEHPNDPPPSGEVVYGSPELLQDLANQLRRWSDEHPSHRIRIRAGRSIHSFIDDNTLEWYAEVRQRAQNARDPEVREWMAKYLKTWGYKEERLRRMMMEQQAEVPK